MFSHIMIGTNDLDVGRTVDQLKQDFRMVCDAYTAAGGRVVVVFDGDDVTPDLLRFLHDVCRPHLTAGTMRLIWF